MRLTTFALAAATLLAAPAAPAAEPTAPETGFWAAYQLALDNDMQIRVAEANYRAARTASPSAWSQYLPQISGSYGISRSQSESSSQAFGSLLVPPSTSESEGSGWSLSLRQTIFNWGTIQQIQQAGANVAQAEAEYQAAQQDLILRVGEAYFDLLAAQDNLITANANLDAIGRQLEQTKKRFEVGLIAVTDVQESQAAYDLATADQIAAERALAEAREVLRVITGEAIVNPAEPGDDLPLQRPEPLDAGQWVERALEQNLSLIANRFAYEASTQNVDAQRAGHYPTIDLSAERSDSSTEFTERLIGGTPQPLFTSEGEQTFISLSLNVPIFSGGATRASVKQALAQASAAQANLQLATRQTEQQARDAYLGVLSEISRVKALAQATQSARTALKATEAGYEVGTRTTVDVLDARRNLFQAQTNYARAKYDYILNTLRLKAAAGMLDAEDVEQVNGWLE